MHPMELCWGGAIVCTPWSCVGRGCSVHSLELCWGGAYKKRLLKISPKPRVEGHNTNS